MEEKKTSKWESFKEFCSDNIELITTAGIVTIVIGSVVAQTVAYKKFLNNQNRIYDKRLLQYYDNCIRVLAAKLDQQ